MASDGCSCPETPRTNAEFCYIKKSLSLSVFWHIPNLCLQYGLEEFVRIPPSLVSLIYCYVPEFVLADSAVGSTSPILIHTVFFSMRHIAQNPRVLNIYWDIPFGFGDFSQYAHTWCNNYLCCPYMYLLWFIFLGIRQIPFVLRERLHTEPLCGLMCSVPHIRQGE